MQRPIATLAAATCIAGCGTTAPRLTTPATGFAPVAAVCARDVPRLRRALHAVTTRGADPHAAAADAQQLGVELGTAERTLPLDAIVAVDAYRAGVFELSSGLVGKDPTVHESPSAAGRRLRRQLDGTPLVTVVRACRV